MTITVADEFDFDNLKRTSWSGALETLNTIEEYGLQDELMDLLVNVFEDCSEKIPTRTEINDFLWFEDEYIFEQLGIEED